MDQNSDIIANISRQLRDRVDRKIHILIAHISVQLAYDFMFSHRYEVSHEDDPPWDRSGRLIRQGGDFSLEDYSCVGDFFEEYTGDTLPSFESGCGLFHSTFDRNYESMICEFVIDCCTEVFSEIGDERLLQLLLEQGFRVSEEDRKDIIGTVIDVELFEEPMWYHFEILEQIESMDFKLMVLRGKEEAIQKYRDQEKRMKESHERLNAEKQAAEKLWSKLLKLYKLQTGKMIQKVQMGDYEMFKQFLDHNQISKEDRVILAKHISGNFSNKVREILSR